MKASDTIYLTVPQILSIHARIVKRTGGGFGIRDLGLLDSAVARPQVGFGGKDAYSSVFDKAAALLHSLLKNHPFVDGNKRTAIASAGIFLKLNGYNLINTHSEEVEFVLEIALENLNINQISKWLKAHSKALNQD